MKYEHSVKCVMIGDKCAYESMGRGTHRTAHNIMRTFRVCVFRFISLSIRLFPSRCGHSMRAAIKLNRTKEKKSQRLFFVRAKCCGLMKTFAHSAYCATVDTNCSNKIETGKKSPANQLDRSPIDREKCANFFGAQFV